MPAIGSFDHPTPRPETRIPFALALLLAARLDMGDIPATNRRATQSGVVIAFVATQVLPWPHRGRLTLDDHGLQCRRELLHVVPVGTRECDRQRDAVGVREQVPLGAEFAAIRRVFAGLIPPFTGADTMALSSDWNRQSMPRRSS